MSSHLFLNESGREVRWGLDLPTGGFFINEFYRDDEEQEDEIVVSLQGLTMSAFATEIVKLYNYVPMYITIQDDIETATAPTQLQHDISKMFNVNLYDKLEELGRDLVEVWGW